MAGLLTVADYRAAAKKRLPRFLFEYLDGAALSEQTQVRNERDFSRWCIRQRVLRDVSAVDLSTTLAGMSVTMPLGLAPVGMAGMYARRGEAQAARAASAAGVPFTLSTVSICDLAEVAKASGVRKPWFQLYVTRDRNLTRALIDRARTLEAGALVLTVDMPVPGTRYRDHRTGLSSQNGWAKSLRLYGQAGLRPQWSWQVGMRGRPHRFANIANELEGQFGIANFWSWMATNFDPTVGWGDIAAIRDQWHGPMLIKGILDPDDARIAIEMGVDGIIVSNHGGRQLDGASSSIEVIEPIRAAVGDGATLLLDGGVRSGVDVFRALALGADGALIGRPWVYALAAGGERAIASLLETIRNELMITMALAGTPRLGDISRHALLPAS